MRVCDSSTQTSASHANNFPTSSSSI
ncbi:unnamed protein product, partial [Brachionus calyciflorus]